MGTEYIEDRVLSARSLTHAEVKFHLGPLVELIKDRKYDLVCAHTVFSSILSSVERQELAKQMWDRVRPGGVIMIFDFRYNNPKNKNVSKVTKKELDCFWDKGCSYYKTDILMPPLARRIVGKNWFIPEMLTMLFPFLRTHFVYAVKKNEY